MNLPIRIGDSADPDSGEACKSLFINDVEVPFWPMPEVVQKHANNPSDAILLVFMNHFVTAVGKCINRRLTLTEILDAVECGRITAGPPPEKL